MLVNWSEQRNEALEVADEVLKVLPDLPNIPLQRMAIAAVIFRSGVMIKRARKFQTGGKKRWETILAKIYSG